MADKHSGEFLRVLVIGKDAELCVDIDDALWIWPHRVLSVPAWDRALQMTRQFAPSAVCVALPLSDQAQVDLRILRTRQPDVPVIGYTSEKDRRALGHADVDSVDIAVACSELRRPRFYELIGKARTVLEARSSDRCKHPVRSVSAVSAPLQHSHVIGTMVLAGNGDVRSANDCIARWLGYDDGHDLEGVCFPGTHLTDTEDWANWTEVTDDRTARLDTHVTAFARDQHYFALHAEIQALASDVRQLQVLCVNETELYLLKSTLGERHQAVDASAGAMR